MGGFSPSLTILWKKWNVRVTVLLSFMLQVVLMVLSNRRKHDSRFWIRVVTWCAYLSADLVATYALGVITNNISHLHETNCGYMGANTELTAFWAPFLLMHLGGPDTITAYSLEDNELWLRHFLGLVVQMVMAIYVCVMAWTGSLLSYLSLLMLFAGLIKYGERTWVLRKASQEKIRDSHLHQYVYQVGSTCTELNNSGGCNLFKAYCLTDLFFRPLFLDLSLRDILRNVNQNVLVSSEEDAFQMIEISLTFTYNNLYTKALLLYTYVGVVLRVITVILTSAVSVVLFPVLTDKYKFSKDVIITFILLFGAIILEIYSAFLLLFSDRFQLWLIKYSKCLTMFRAFKRVLPKKKWWSDRFQLWLRKHRKCLMMFEAFKCVLPKKRRWSSKMSQLSLLSFITKEKPLPCRNLLKHFSIVGELENQWYAVDIEISNNLKTLIFRYLKTKKERPTTPSEASGSKIPNDLETSQSESLNIDGCDIDFTKEVEKSIIAWHVATEKWYEQDREHVKGGHVYELICQISRYMFSLLVLHPDMLSNANTTTFTLQPMLVPARHLEKLQDRNEASQKISDWISRVYDGYEHQNLDGLQRRTRDFFIENLPKLLQGLSTKNCWQWRWMMMGCAWLEMLAYAAFKCRGVQHAQRLRCGGELLTHVWLLTKCFRFTEEDFKPHAPRWASDVLEFGGVCSSRCGLVLSPPNMEEDQTSILHLLEELIDLLHMLEEIWLYRLQYGGD